MKVIPLAVPLKRPAVHVRLCPLVRKMDRLSPQCQRCQVPETRRTWYLRTFPKFMGWVLRRPAWLERWLTLVVSCHKDGKCRVCPDMPKEAAEESTQKTFDGKLPISRQRQCA